MRRKWSERKIPVTKVVIKPASAPSHEIDKVRLRFLERPYRFYHRLPYYVKVYMKTAVISFGIIGFLYFLSVRVATGYA